MNDIVKVSVSGCELLAVEKDGHVWVPVKRVCEVLGIDHRSQREKLQNQRWAVGVLITSTAPDGKNYDTFCIRSDRLAMWLATIDAGRVKEEARPALEALQCEAAEALAAHFAKAQESRGKVAYLTGALREFDARADWERLWSDDVVLSICKLYRWPTTNVNGTMYAPLSGVFERLYRLLLGDEIYEEVKRRNPRPRHGQNHHQLFKEKVRELIGHRVVLVKILADQSASPEEWWCRLRACYRKEMLQLPVNWEARQ